jgi:hypothetical protein
MADSPRIEEWTRFSAARQVAGIATDESYVFWDKSPNIVSGTATNYDTEPMAFKPVRTERHKSMQPDVVHLTAVTQRRAGSQRMLAEKALSDAVRFTDFVPINVARKHLYVGSATSDIFSASNMREEDLFSIVHGSIASSFVFEIRPGRGVGAYDVATGSLDEILTVSGPLPRDYEVAQLIQEANDAGLKEIGVRLAELEGLPLAEDEEPLKLGSMRQFIEYCAFRGTNHRPLITASASGEIDATWNGSNEDVLGMRFFSNTIVHVHWRREGGIGTFAARWADMLDAEFPFKIPDWA